VGTPRGQSTHSNKTGLHRGTELDRRDFGVDFRIGIILWALGGRRASPEAMAHR